MSVLKRLISFTAILAWFGFIEILEGGRLGNLFQGTSFIGVVGLTLLASIHHLGLKATVGGVSNSILGTSIIEVPGPSLAEFRRCAPGWAMFSSNLVVALGLLHVMLKLEEPSEIGKGVAVAFLAYVYGGLLVLIFSGAGAQGSEGVSGRPRASDALTAPVGLALLFMTVMYAISSR